MFEFLPLVMLLAIASPMYDDADNLTIQIAVQNGQVQDMYSITMYKVENCEEIINNSQHLENNINKGKFMCVADKLIKIKKIRNIREDTK